MKKLPLFWKIYIFAVTVVILLICGFFVILSINLRKYEQTAEEDRRTHRLEAEAAEHTLTVRMKDGNADKEFTILAIGYGE